MADENVYKIISGNTVTIVSGTDVYDAAAKVGTSPLDPKTSIRSLSTGCYQPTLAEAKTKYEKDPVADFGYKPPKEDDKDTKPEITDTTYKPKTDTDKDKIEPIPVQPSTITKYQFKLDDGTVKTFEAMTADEAEGYVRKWKADVDTLSIVGTRDLSQYEIKEILRSSAVRSDMDYARSLVKYDQVTGVVPVRDGGTGEAMLISEVDWNSLSKDYQKLVTSKGLDALNRTIYNELPDKYQLIADKKDLAAAINEYNADVERANEVIDKLKPYKDGNSYDIVTPLQLGIVTDDDLSAAGFDSKDVKGVNEYVNKLSALIAKWDKQSTAGTFLTSKSMTQGQLNDFNNAIVEAGLIKKYKMGDWGTELTFTAPNVLAKKWETDFTLEDKYNVAEIYAAYPAPAGLLSSTYRGMVTEASNMAPAARFIKQFTLGGAAATLKPFVKEQIKDHLQVVLEKYKEDGGYNITRYLKDYPEDAGLLARGGIEVKELEKALDGQRVVAEVKGASKQDWAVAGLIVVAVGAGGASLLVTQPAKAGLVATSGLAQLGLGTYATVDTVKYWREMDNTQRAIAIAFDVLLLTSGALATKGGLTRFKAEGGFLKIRNKIMYNYRAARNVIKKLLPNSKKAEWILSDIDRAIKTGDAKLIQAAAKQLQIEAAKLPKQLGDPLVKRAKLIQAAPDNYIKLGDKPKAPQDLINAIQGNEAFIREAGAALKRIKDPKKLSTIQQALRKAMLDREKLRVATKQKTVETPFQKVIWDKEAGKYVPAKTGVTTAVTKYKPTVPAKAPETIIVGAKKKPIPVEDLRKYRPSRVAQKHFVSIYDICRSLRQLPKGIQDEIASISPAWTVVVQSQTATKTELQRRLKQVQKQKQKIAPVPFPIPQTATQPELAPAHKVKQKKKLAEKEALAIYPFLNITQDIKTRYKRRRPRIDSEEVEDITERLPRDKKGIQTWKQGLFYITGFPPYRPQDFIYTKKRPYYAETSKGKRSPQRTVKAVGGKVPHLITLPMGVVTARVKGGDELIFRRRGNGQRRKGRRRGRLVY